MAPFEGRAIQTKRENKIANAGPKLKALVFLMAGASGSFENNLIASLNGCSSPPNLTLLGPLRSCEYPKIFRSIRVIKATLISTGIIIIK